MGRRRRPTPEEVAAQVAAEAAAAREAAIAEQVRLGVMNVNVGGKNVTLASPKDRLDALERMEQRAARGSEPTLMQLDDGIFL